MATISLYGAFPGHLADKLVDWDSDTIKVALLTSSYTPNQDTHDFFDDVAASEATGTGYTAGGATLTGATKSYNAATNVRTFDGNDVEWSNSTITARYAVIYDATPGSAATNPLIAYVDFGSDRSSNSGLFRVAWNASGIFTITV